MIENESAWNLGGRNFLPEITWNRLQSTQWKTKRNKRYCDLFFVDLMNFMDILQMMYAIRISF